MRKQSTTTTTKAVTILNIYRFKQVARICFIVESSNETDTYNTCFNGDAQHGSCTCDGNAQWHKECYHIEQLRPIAQKYFEARNQAAPVVAAQATYSTSEQRHQAPLNSNRSFNIMR